MVDYTAPAFRDDTWNRWKGGVKAALKLSADYTSDSAKRRNAAFNKVAMPSEKAKAEDKYAKRFFGQMSNWGRRQAMLRNRAGGDENGKLYRVPNIHQLRASSGRQR